MITIEKAKLGDVDIIVEIHLDAFKDFFLSSLGKRFLRLYYLSFIKSDRGVVYCAHVDNVVVGFSACSYIGKGFNSSLIKSNPIRFGIEALRLLLTKPKALVRLVKNMKKGTGIEDDGMYAELYSIAINPKYQGEGVGRKLLTATEQDVRTHNDRISLTTDFYNNEKTLSFYRALGYKDYYVFVSYPSRKMYRMIKDL